MYVPKSYNPDTDQMNYPTYHNDSGTYLEVYGYLEVAEDNFDSSYTFEEMSEEEALRLASSKGWEGIHLDYTFPRSW